MEISSQLHTTAALSPVVRASGSTQKKVQVGGFQSRFWRFEKKRICLSCQEANDASSVV
jgi:hypothetical protein